MRRLFLFAMVAAFFAAMLPARAQTVDGIEQAWRSWAAKYGQRTGGMVILHAGQPVREVAMGRAAVGAPVPLASLSKAITGVCIANLIDRGRLSFDTPLSQALARTFARIGLTLDQVTHGHVFAVVAKQRKMDAGGDAQLAVEVHGNRPAYVR